VVFAACPGDPKFNRASLAVFSSPPLAPVLHHNLNTSQIEALRPGRAPSGGLHNPGLTIAEQTMKTDYRIGGSKNSRSKHYCVWAESVKVEFHYTKMDVYVSNQYAKETCAYKVILDHENQHVAINQRVLAKYLAFMKAALKRDRTIPTKANPLAASTLESGRAAIAARVERVLQPLDRQYMKEVRAENAKIDTLANYKKTQAKCKEW
jgi:hypothetical protein